MIKLSYSTLTVVRNEQQTIQQVITSIMDQSVTPEYVMIVDDGSTDQTADILWQLENENPLLYVLTRKDRGYGALGTYLMADVYNDGLGILNGFSDWDQLAIIPGDLIMERRYMEKILNVMDDKTGIAGGNTKQFSGDYNKDHIIGAGRVIKREILKHLNNRLPRNYNWEQAVLHCSDYLGLEIKKVNDAFFTMRREGSGHDMDYPGSGRAMKNANYHPVVVLGRVLKESLVRHNFSRAIRMLVGYLAEPASDYPDYSIYLREKQKRRIVNRK